MQNSEITPTLAKSPLCTFLHKAHNSKADSPAPAPPPLGGDALAYQEPQIAKTMNNLHQIQR